MKLKKSQTLQAVMIVVGLSLALIGTVGFYSNFGGTQKVTGRIAELPKIEIPKQLRYSRILSIVLGVFIGLGFSKIVMRTLNKIE